MEVPAAEDTDHRELHLVSGRIIAVNAVSIVQLIFISTRRWLGLVPFGREAIAWVPNGRTLS